MKSQSVPSLSGKEAFGFEGRVLALHRRGFASPSLYLAPSQVDGYETPWKEHWQGMSSSRSSARDKTDGRNLAQAVPLVCVTAQGELVLSFE